MNQLKFDHSNNHILEAMGVTEQDYNTVYRTITRQVTEFILTENKENELTDLTMTRLAEEYALTDHFHQLVEKVGGANAYFALGMIFEQVIRKVSTLNNLFKEELINANT